MTTHSPTHHSTRRPGHLLAIVFTALALLLSFTPGASAQVRSTTTTASAPAAGDATFRCPDRWVFGPHGCQPGFITIEQPTLIKIGCADGWVLGPQGCQPNNYTSTITRTILPTCPQGWVPASVPGGCLPNRFTLAIGGNVVQAQYHCAFGPACAPMVDAIKALGGSCVKDGPDVTCDLPPVHPDRD